MTSARICQNLIELILGFAPKNSNTLVKNARENDQYRFRTVQNKAIQVFQGYIKKKIVSEVKESRAGSLIQGSVILADKANDICNKEQRSLVLRYLNKKGEISERFASLKAYCRCSLQFRYETEFETRENVENKLHF